MVYRLESVDLSRYLLIRDMKFRFRKGITLIGGDNRVGKSLAFSGLSPTLYYRESDYKHPKGSTFTLKFSRETGKVKDRYAIKATTNKGSKLSVFLNEEDQTPHTLKDAQGLISGAWVIPYDLFYSTVMLQGTRTHPLAMGTPSKRSAWLANVLDLVSIYDEYADKVSDMLANCKTEKTRLEVLEDQLSQLPSVTTEISKKDYNSALKVVKSNRAPELSDNVETIRKRLQHLINVGKLKPTVKVKGGAKDLSKKRDLLTKKVAKLELSLEEVRTNEKVANKFKAGTKKFGDLTKKEWSRIKRQLSTSVTQLSEFEDSKALYDEQSEQREQVKHWKETGYSPTNSKSGSSALKMKDQIKGKLSHLRGQVESLTSLLKAGKPKCSTCGATIKKGEVKGQVNTLKKEIAALSDTLQELRDEFLYWKVQEIEFVPRPVRPKITKEKIREREEWLESARDWLIFKETYSGSKVGDPGSIRRELDKARKQLSKVKKDYDAVKAYEIASAAIPDDLMSLSVQELRKRYSKTKREYDKAKKELQNYTTTLVEARSIVDRYREQVRAAKQISKQREALEGQINETKKVTKDIPALMGLQQAFGSTGLRLLQLKESAKVFENKLTELSSLFFDVPYTFRVNVAPRKLDIIIERNGIEGTLSTLSGSESKAWSLLCAMALLHLLPNRLRCDTMILDEIESTMSKKSRDRYTTEVLPELRNLVPNIVMVTPLVSGELRLVPDFDYRMVKTYEKGQFVSRLVQQ